MIIFCSIYSLVDTFKVCTNKNDRIAAGLGNPPNKFNNQRTESMNSVVKEAIGTRYSDQQQYMRLFTTL